jgi:hypothetical protein
MVLGMACSLAAPCGGTARLILELPDASVWQCFGAAHTIRVGAPAPPWRPAQMPHPDVPDKRPRYCRWRNCKARPTRRSVFCWHHRVR